MYIWFILITVVYYAVLFGWYRSSRRNPVKEEEEPPSKPPRTDCIIGASNHAKRKEAQRGARDDKAAQDVDQVVVNTPIFAASNAEIPSAAIPVEELNKAFSETPLTAEEEAELEGEEPANKDIDLKEEEEELSRYRAIGEDETNYASGISFEELGRLGTLLQQNAVDEKEVAEAGEALQKIAGTTLLDSILSALPDSLKRVSEQIDAQLQKSSRNNERTPEWMNFDIKQYTYTE